MTGAGRPMTRSASDEMRANIAARVRRADTVQIDPALTRMIVHWLGQHAELARLRYGSPPVGLPEAQQILAEACVDVSENSCRQQENHLTAIQPLISGHDSEVDTAEAAAVLGLTRGGVRYHCENDNLEYRRCGRQFMITRTSLAELKAHRENRKRA